MEPITIIRHEGFDELTAPQGRYITQAAELPDDCLRTFSSRRTCAPGADTTAWRTATEAEKLQAEAEMRIEVETL